MKRTTLQAMASYRPELRDAHIYQSVRSSPGWCKARYLRTLEGYNKDRTLMGGDGREGAR